MYYQGNSEIQADGLQTLYLMNPNNYNAYSDTSHQQSGNMLIFNYPSGNGINLESLPNGHQSQSQSQPQHHHHLVGVPLQAVGGGGSTSTTATINRHLHQCLWGSSSLDYGNQENGNIHSGVVVASSSGIRGHQPEVSVAQLGYNHHHHHHQLPVVSPTQQGLSLSLSSQQPGFKSISMDHNIDGGGGSSSGGGNFQASTIGASSSISLITNGISGSNNFLLGSKFLKSARELLDEVVSIASKEIKTEIIITEKKEEKTKSLRGETSGSESTAAMATELTAAQKQEVQIKKAKLISMLDEVEQRYAQYHHQMQVVITSFEQASGVGSARSYTQLALQTISKQFRCLKDAISAQIKAANKSLGEKDEDHILELGKTHAGSSRLKFVDQQIRQQRALQHFGMIQTNNVWRPQRGLPERAVSVLRAWLFEHFLHPYPKDSDKILLAKQTGLTRSQVSNWFINARVRLWKPMVEEMYAEEMKNQETLASESNKQDHSTTTKSSSPKDHMMNMTMLPPKESFNDQEKRKIPATDLSEISRFGLVSDELINPDGISDKNPKRIRQEDDHQMQNIVPISTMISDDMMEKESFQNDLGIGNGLIGAFSFGDLENFNPEFHGGGGSCGGGGGGGVSLTLGLPPSDHQQNFFSNQNIELRNNLEMGSGGQGNYDQIRVHKLHQAPHQINIGYNETLRFPNS